jgi:hypothetical protein
MIDAVTYLPHSAIGFASHVLNDVWPTSPRWGVLFHGEPAGHPGLLVARLVTDHSVFPSW